MSRLAVEHTANEPTTLIDVSYNSTMWNLGSLIKQRNDLNPPFIGPLIVANQRPAEQGVALANLGMYPWAMQWDVSNGIDWVFLADQTAAGATRRVQLYEYNRNNSNFNWKGYVTLTLPFAGVHTITGFRMSYEEYNIGQVTASGQWVYSAGDAIDGSARWLTDRLNVGNRIGFGSKDPAQIAPSNWYTISYIARDGSILITPAISTPISVSTNYVIEDLRAVLYTTNTTLINGGLYIAKGLNYNDFNAGGGICTSCNIPVDSSKYTYHLAPIQPWVAGNIINALDVSACGICIEPKIDWQTQYVYGINLGNATASPLMRVWKYNIRALLTVTATYGTAINAINCSTGMGTTGSATISRLNNGRFLKMLSGTLADVSALYYVTATRVNAMKTSSITEGSTTFAVDGGEMQEKPPGTVSLYAVTGTLTGLEYASSIDRLLVMTSGAAANHSYITQFNTNIQAYDHIFLADDKQINQSLANPDNVNVTPHINTLSIYQAPWVENGVLYTAGTGTTAITNIMHTAPIGADWTYSSSTYTAGRLISPKFLTPNCNKFVRAYQIQDRILGSDVLGKRSDAIRLSYRTSGINDNSGNWTTLTEPNDLSGAGSSSEIQLMVEFKCISEYCIPARVMALCVVYDDTTTDSHFRLSQVNSNIITKTFAWRFVTAFDASVPALKIILWDDVGNSPLVTDYTDTSTGVWSKSYTDGNTWVQYDSSDKGASNITYIRYTPSALADNTKVRAMLTLK